MSDFDSPRTLKFSVTFKFPEIESQVREAIESDLEMDEAFEKLPKWEQKQIIEGHVEDAWEKLSKWIEYREYVRVEFDLDSNSATVIEN
jgi:hypothetical protein